MKRPRRFLRLLLPALLLAGTLTHPAPASAQPVPGPIRFIPQNPESSVRIDARFPRKPDVCEAKQPRNLHAAYKGVLEVGRRADGSLYLVSELTFPEYLSGIAEVPRSWPLEALKAQVVAARTYAISRLNPSSAAAREIKYDICATDSCQVYRGLSVEKGPWGDQWARAVAETQGQILQYNGKPAETFYFSTSNGKTHSNKDAFGGSPLPYLKPVEEADDTQSPLSNWTVRMPLGDLTETLRLADVWTATGSIEDVDQDEGEVKVSGGGASKTMTIEQFRARLNSQAVCLVPKRYPTADANGVRYPQVVPSKWMKVHREGADAVMTGRGWGHGVGMVQWGLKGKAEKGQTYDQMLSHYYSGLKPSTVDEPGKIRVLLA
ncbi:MAG: SpoIID/LytB domain-containing protein, partial [Actinomycetota bacterium]